MHGKLYSDERLVRIKLLPITLPPKLHKHRIYDLEKKNVSNYLQTTRTVYYMYIFLFFIRKYKDESY